MAIIALMLICSFGSVLVFAIAQKHGFSLGAVSKFWSRFSTPYNALATFALCLALFLGGHNRLPSALGGAFVVVGASTVLGLVLRAARAALPRLRTVPLPVLRRKKVGDGYWEFENGEWVEVEREVETKTKPEMVSR